MPMFFPEIFQTHETLGLNSLRIGHQCFGVSRTQLHHCVVFVTIDTKGMSTNQVSWPTPMLEVYESSAKGSTSDITISKSHYQVSRTTACPLLLANNPNNDIVMINWPLSIYHYYITSLMNHYALTIIHPYLLETNHQLFFAG